MANVFVGKAWPPVAKPRQNAQNIAYVTMASVNAGMSNVN